MSTIDYTTLASHLAEIPDPRSPRGRRYEWHYLLILIAAAMLTGASMPTAISQGRGESGGVDRSVATGAQECAKHGNVATCIV